MDRREEMKTRTEYMRMFENENEALDRCEMKNKACKAANNTRDIFAVIEGPEENWAVVDLTTAIEFGQGYRILY